MGSIQAHELTLDCKPSFVPRTIFVFLGQVSNIENVNDKLLKIDELITKLDDEMRKIEAFKRELPLSMLLLNDAIVALKEEGKQCRKLNAKQVLKEFIPLKKSCDEDDDKKVDDVKKEKENKERMNWMSSVQLWNSDDHHSSSLESRNSIVITEPVTIKRVEEKVNNVVLDGPFKSCSNQLEGIGFLPSKGSTGSPMEVMRKGEKEEIVGLPELSLQTPGMKNLKDETVTSGLALKTGASRIDSSSATNNQSSLCGEPQPEQHQHQTSRKQRRCWSPELHRRFVDALQQLGGSQVATPKQIREIMQVDGLTNDEVKSHLQKYRLHTRRLSTRNQSGLGPWNPQDQYGESSKQSNPQSGSPEGPLHFSAASRGTSTTRGDSMEDEDGKSDCHSWKSHVHLSKRNISV